MNDLAVSACEDRLPLDHIMVKQCGFEKSSSDFQCGPAVRDDYLLHYIASGKGVFHSERGDFKLRAGQGFIIFPHEVTWYESDSEAPMAYAWAGYHGIGADALTRQIGLSKNNPVFSVGPVEQIFGLLQTMTHEIAQLRLGNLAALGALLHFLSLIAQNNKETLMDSHQQYFEKARWFMEGNYNRKILVTDIADFVNLSRSQLFRVFMEVSGISPKESLTKIRLKKALPLLEGKQLKLTEIASSLGFSNSAQFAHSFRQYYGMSPRSWKNKQAISSETAV